MLLMFFLGGFDYLVNFSVVLYKLTVEFVVSRVLLDDSFGVGYKRLCPAGCRSIPSVKIGAFSGLK